MLNESIPLKIATLETDETILYAGEELCKYIAIMAGKGDAAELNNDVIDNEADIKLGLFSDFNIKIEDVIGTEKDDAIHIDIKNSKGIIAGSNPRSVLFAVYRFLEGNGCKWIRPGKDGKVIPKRNINNLNAKIFEKATSIFRGNNNCGSYSFEHMMDLIDWMPKVALNTIFFERIGDLLNNWYNVDYKSIRKQNLKTDADIKCYYQQLVSEIKKRGLIFQLGGHGFIAQSLGLPEEHASDEKEFIKMYGKEHPYLALVDGKREIHKWGMNYTELCYGNVYARTNLVNYMVKYIISHPEADILHFWLSDASSHCECELCKDTRPSDFYVMMLNEIDDILSQKGVKTRIVFLIYQDLLWAPVKETIKNSERFILMFAPISRLYDKPYEYSQNPGEGFKEYNRNNNIKPEKVSENLIALKDWKRTHDGYAFSFDYHMTWHHYHDMGYYSFAKIMSEDIKAMPELKLNGFVSCQNVRSCFPTSFPFHVHAKFLWDNNNNFDQLAKQYFEDAFGNDGQLCLEYMKELSELFCPNFFYGNYESKNILGDKIVIEKLSKITSVVDDFRPIVEKNMYCENSTIAKSWRYIFIHQELCVLLSNALRAKVEGNEKISEAYWDKVVNYVVISEKAVEAVFDLLWFYMAYESWSKIFPNSKSIFDLHYQPAE